jgi:hypothetical protein
VRGGEYVSEPSKEERLQGVRGVGLCPHKRQRIQCKECGGGEHLPAPAHHEHNRRRQDAAPSSPLEKVAA